MTRERDKKNAGHGQPNMKLRWLKMIFFKSRRHKVMHENEYLLSVSYKLALATHNFLCLKKRITKD